MRLGGRSAIVTGASSGIGAATARLFAGEGARVLVVARSEAPLSRLASEQEGIYPFLCDVAAENAADAIVGEAVRLFGGLHILVNNAAHQVVTLTPPMP